MGRKVRRGAIALAVVIVPVVVLSTSAVALARVGVFRPLSSLVAQAVDDTTTTAPEATAHDRSGHHHHRRRRYHQPSIDDLAHHWLKGMSDIPVLIVRFIFRRSL